jgi:hypothetical protein
VPFDIAPVELSERRFGYEVERRSHFDSCSFTRRFTYVLSLSGQFRYVEIQARLRLAGRAHGAWQYAKPGPLSLDLNYRACGFHTFNCGSSQHSVGMAAAARSSIHGADDLGACVSFCNPERLRHHGRAQCAYDLDCCAATLYALPLFFERTRRTISVR